MSDSTIFSLPLQLFLFDFQELSPTNYSEEELEYYRFLSVLESLLLPNEKRLLFNEARTGRKGCSGFQILAILLLKMYRRCGTVRDVLAILRREPVYRSIIGLRETPSEATLSRRTKELEGIVNIMDLHERLVNAFYKDRLVCNLSIDSTPIDTCEEPLKKEKKEKCKRGPKKKGSPEEAEYKKRQEEKEALKELRDNGDVRTYIDTLEGRCSITGKENSKGHIAWRIGYKIHFAVDDNGIPVSYVVTGACVHDSKLAIPLLRMANERCNFFYALMDSGYSCPDIENAVRRMGKIPVIDWKAEKDGSKREMDQAKKQRYKARTTVERSNSEVKGCFLPDRLHSRGSKAKLDIEIAILLLTMKRMRMVLLREQEFQEDRKQGA